jgi:hypothetical protein
MNFLTTTFCKITGITGIRNTRLTINSWVIVNYLRAEPRINHLKLY